MRKLALVPILLLLAVPARAQQLRLLQDVIYSQAGGHLIAMDAYLWDWGSLAPAVVYIHGGGWREGDKKDVPEFLEKGLFDAGISLISVNYRLSQQAPYPAQLDDVTRAIQFVRHKAASWHIDADRMAVMGESAGAHLALWIGLHDDRRDLDSDDPVERQSTRVSAIVNYYGRAFFTRENEHPFVRQFFGLKEGDALSLVSDDRLQEASPITYASRGDPAVFTYHGKKDEAVPVSQAEALIAKLRSFGVSMETHLVENAGHGLDKANPAGPDFQTATIKFLERHLGR